MGIQRYIDELQKRGITCLENTYVFDTLAGDCFADLLLLTNGDQFSCQIVCRGESNGYGDELPESWNPIEDYVDDCIDQMEWTTEEEAREELSDDRWEVVEY